jgi:hypothetical protein
MSGTVTMRPAVVKRQAAPSIAPFLIDTRYNQLAFNR